MQRLAESDLAAWKRGRRRKPLIVRGARQVGKTWLLERFGEVHFPERFKVDLEKRRDLHGIFAGDLAPQNILPQLEIALGQRIIPGRTLLFLDEIQSCPRALMALRYFYEEQPELHVVAAGSLIEFALREISFPVGRVQFLELRPMSFVEFLLAGGLDLLAAEVRAPPKRLPETIHAMLLKRVRDYFFVGGMPEAVRVYWEEGSLLPAFEVQAEIIEAYRQDFSKYAPRADKDALDQVLSGVARHMGNQVKYTRLGEGFTGPTYHKAFDLLRTARVIHKVPSTDPSGLPLSAGSNARKFKAIVVDIGLLQRLCRLPVDVEITRTDLLSIFRGRLAEQFVAQELMMSQSDDLYYWARDARGSAAEVDLLFVRAGKVHPVEVKSGKGGTLRSLHIFLDRHPSCEPGYVLYSGIYAERPELRLVFTPIYYAASLASTAVPTRRTASLG